MPQNTKKISFDGVLKLLFLPLPVTCLLLNLYLLIICFLEYRNDASGMARILLLVGPLVLSGIVLLIPFRILLSGKLLSILGIIAAAVLSHQMYTTTAFLSAFLSLANADIAFLMFCIFALCGLTAFALYVRASKRKWLPVVFTMMVIAVCFVIGSGNPQWSRIIYIYQVYYSPWKTDPSNLKTDRRQLRLTYPKYTEWDKYGRKTVEWSHPEGVLLRTDYFSDGTIKGKRLYDVEQFSTSWYSNGQMGFEYNKTTRQKRSWNEDGSVCEGRITERFEDSNNVRSIQHFKNGLWHGTQQWYNRSGTLWKEEEYLEGRRHGVYREWHTNGILHEESHYIDDLREGLSQSWNDKGKLEWTKHYSKGVED